MRSIIRHPLRLTLGAGALLLALGACIESTNVAAATPYAYFIVNVDPTGSGYTVNPNGQVFLSPTLALPNSHFKGDSCAIYLYGTPADTPLSYINGGDSIAFTSDGVTRYLKPTTVNSIVKYALPATAVPFATPGSSVTIATPGVASGFPTSSLTTNTAPALTLASPVVNTDGSVTLAWNPGDDSTRVGIALAYASASAGLDREVFCSVTDDGAFTVPSSLTQGYVASTQKRVEASRWRGALLHVANTGDLFVYSSFNITPFTP